VEIHAATHDLDLRVRIAAGAFRGLRLDDAGRTSVYGELAGLEPDAGLRERLRAIAADPSGVALRSGLRIDDFLRGGEPGAK
jgi:hypothetical protein